ncbi:MAG: helix-turn-helix domain-containing protein, partial [Acetobacteraceae bacterium]|nr:helix-turn-helix domain-containing protein [Acetobacteraceae bacterium]
SPRQLERLFHRALGQGPGVVYRAIRLRYARWLLDSTNWSVTDIALAAGFTDCAHFSRQFKEHNGFSPSISRAERRQGEDDPQSRATMAGVRVFG